MLGQPPGAPYPGYPPPAVGRGWWGRGAELLTSPGVRGQAGQARAVTTPPTHSLPPRTVLVAGLSS